VIKVIIGYKVKRGSDIGPVLLKLRSHAMTFPGHVGSENLVNVYDRSIVAMVQTWDKTESWKQWEPSLIRRSILASAEIMLEEEPRVTVYEVLPSHGWDSAARSS
jgi:antibiotic biosynthesis monooxygenase (ABM) superfamily enzyme